MGDPAASLWLLFLGSSFFFGSAVGSFGNVVVYRLPQGRSVVHPPSACPHCRNPIRPWHNVPVVGWLLLRGRCADCGEPISPRYPLVEAACGVLWVLLYLHFVPTPQRVLEPELLAVFGAFAVYASAVLMAVLIDADHFILPDSITLPLIPLGIAAHGLLGAADLSPVPMPSAVFGAIAGGGVMVSITLLGRALYGREAMGLGDAKLLAAIGAWQGLHPTLLLTVLFAASAGSVVGIAGIAVGLRERTSKMPFGPYLALGALLSLLFGGRIAAAWGIA